MNTTRQTILVVDDDRAAFELLAAMLEMEGYQALTACDGEQGLALMRSSLHRLVVITGLIMPGMGGQEMLRIAASEGLLNRHVVVIVSGAAPHVRRDEDVARILDRYEIPVIPKPFDGDELLDHVERAAKRLQLPILEHNGFRPT